MQPDQEDYTKHLALYRLEKAKEDFAVAELTLEHEQYRSANNRAYYAIYHAITAILALDKVAFKRHKDTLGHFNKEYVKNNIFPRELGHRIAVAQEIRQASDYDDFYIATRAQAVEQIETAKRVIELVEQYLQEKLIYEESFRE